MTDDALLEQRARRRDADPGRFAREGGRVRFTARRARVARLGRPAPHFVRVTFAGPELQDFVSIGPTDHVRIFFPDPDTGAYVAPTAVGPDADGLIRPDKPVISRDFTPFPPRRTADGGVEVDVDFFVHADPGTAAAWAASASVGDELVIVGPRGSRRAPQNIDGLILLCDETSLPAVHRWVRDIPDGCDVRIIATVPGDGAWVEDYVGEVAGITIDVTVVNPDATGEAALAALRRLGPVDEAVYVWAAGEASALVPIRRYLRRELGLPAYQVGVSGYWRRGTANFDHHTPVDPDDPD